LPGSNRLSTSLEFFMQIKTVLKKALISIRNIMLVDLAICLLVSFSFVFTGKFSFLSYSDRVFWAGLGMTLIAALVALASMFSGSSFGIPSIIRKPEEAKRLLDHFEDYRDLVNKRQDISIRLFFIGLGCIAISAFVQTVLA
jgi:hypothetical protein